MCSLSSICLYWHTVLSIFMTMFWSICLSSDPVKLVGYWLIVFCGLKFKAAECKELSFFAINTKECWCTILSYHLISIVPSHCQQLLVQLCSSSQVAVLQQLNVAGSYCLCVHIFYINEGYWAFSFTQ